MSQGHVRARLGHHQTPVAVIRLYPPRSRVGKSGNTKPALVSGIEKQMVNIQVKTMKND